VGKNAWINGVKLEADERKLGKGFPHGTTKQEGPQ